MTLNLLRVTTLSLIPTMALPLAATAQDTSAPATFELAQSKGGPQGGRPPREAFEACESKAVNDACTVSLNGGETLEGTCQEPPRGRDNAMVCAPKGGRAKG